MGLRGLAHPVPSSVSRQRSRQQRSARTAPRALSGGESRSAASTSSPSVVDGLVQLLTDATDLPERVRACFAAVQKAAGDGYQLKRPGGARSSAGSPPLAHAPQRWVAWQQVFSEVARQERLAIELETKLEEAVAREDYTLAGKLHGALGKVHEADAVAELMESFQTALQEQRFEEAVRLRDCGAGLVGWWVGQGMPTGGPGEPNGCLLHVEAKQGRFVGRAFMAKDLADLQALKANNPKGYDLEGGRPVLELYVSRDQEGGVQQQPVVLYDPSSAMQKMQDHDVVAAEEHERMAAATAAAANSDDEQQQLHHPFARTVTDELEHLAAGMQVVETELDEEDEDAALLLQATEGSVERHPARLHAHGLHKFVFEYDEAPEAALDVSLSAEVHVADEQRHQNLHHHEEPPSTSAAHDDENFVNPFDTAAKEAADAVGMPLLPQTLFRRIDPEVARGTSLDPFTQLYIGTFGPHGSEAVQLIRGRWGDEPCDDPDSVTAIKLTGDGHVPTGAASFRAKVGHQHRLDPHDGYPEALGVVARYPGEGRVAKHGFKEPSWVSGELLVFDGRSGVTDGSELGFVWHESPRRFLILFSKLQLG